MRFLLALALMLVPVGVEAQTATRGPVQVQFQLATGGAPEPHKLGADHMACLRGVGISTFDGLEALIARTPTTNPEAVAKLRTLASWLECMNIRGYVLPTEWMWQ